MSDLLSEKSLIYTTVDIYIQYKHLNSTTMCLILKFPDHRLYKKNLFNPLNDKDPGIDKSLDLRSIKFIKK